MRRVVVERDRDLARVLARFLGDDPARVVVLLGIHRVHRPNRKTQAAALADASRDEREMVEIIAFDGPGLDPLRPTQALAMACAQRVAGQEYAAAVRFDLEYVDCE